MNPAFAAGLAAAPFNYSMIHLVSLHLGCAVC